MVAVCMHHYPRLDRVRELYRKAVLTRALISEMVRTGFYVWLEIQPVTHTVYVILVISGMLVNTLSLSS